jgi:hypothetical protein
VKAGWDGVVDAPPAGPPNPNDPEGGADVGVVGVAAALLVPNPKPVDAGGGAEAPKPGDALLLAGAPKAKLNPPPAPPAGVCCAPPNGLAFGLEAPNAGAGVGAAGVVEPKPNEVVCAG